VYITTTDNVNKKYDDVVAKGYCCYHQKINKKKAAGVKQKGNGV